MSPASAGTHARRSPETRALQAGRIAWAALLVGAIVVIVSAVYLRPFLEQPERFPHGVDTPGYVTRSRLVYEEGLNALTRFGERPGHPIVTSVLRDVTGGAPLDLARMWPAMFAVAIGLAAAALGAGVAGERRWVGAALGAGLAASPFVALTAIGYASNVLLDAFAVAAVALVVRVRSGGRGVAGLVLLLGAAVIAHWLFAILLFALLAAYAAGVVLVTWFRRRSDGAWRDPRRLVVAVGLGALLGLVLLLASPERPDHAPSPKQGAAGKIATRLPPMSLGVTLPLAGIGAAVMWLSRRPVTRRVEVPLAMWALAAPVGLIAWKAFDMTIPHRTVPFALGVPALIVLGAAATRSWTDAMAPRPERRRWVLAGAIMSAVLVLAAATWLTLRGADTWLQPRAAFTQEQFAQASILTAYLETLPPDTPIVIPMGSGLWRPVRPLMVTLPAERFLDVRSWRADFFGNNARFRRRLAAEFPANTVAVYLAGYSAQTPLEGIRLGPGVRLLAGPRPHADPSVTPATKSRPGELIRLTGTSIVTLLLLGLGWAIVLTGLPMFAVVCLSPVVGLAALSVGGLVAGRLGFPLGEGGGVLVALAVGLLGWLAALIGSRRRSPAPEREPETASPVPIEAGGRHLAGKRRVRGQ
jgi:hypothetical protein